MTKKEQSTPITKNTKSVKTKSVKTVAASPAVKKTKAKAVVKKSVKSVVKSEDVSVKEETKEETKDVIVEESTVSDENTSKTKIVDVEGLFSIFDGIIDNISKRLEITGDKTSARFLKTVSKDVKDLKAKTSQFLKKKRRVKRNTSSNKNSGFLKPVKISAEMSKFTGWNPNDLHSRVDVTKYLCNYIKENNLQNPKDRRQIIMDDKLSKLLDFDEKDSNPLTYFRIQSCIKNHFPK